MDKVIDLISELPSDALLNVVQLLTLDTLSRVDRDMILFQLGINIGRNINGSSLKGLINLIQLCDYYPNLCKGIARGIYEKEVVDKDLVLNLGKLSPIMARELLANLDLYKFPEVMKSLANSVSQLKYLPNVGSNIAKQIDKLPFEFRNQIINTLKDNGMFLYEFLQTVNLSKIDNIDQFIGKNKDIDEIIGYRLSELNDRLKERLLNFPTIAKGVGKGFQNLSYYWKRKVIEKVKEDKEFAKGFLSSIDLVSLEDEFIDEIIKEATRDEELSKVLGKNFGESFPSLNEFLKNTSFKITENNPNFAYGFGEGISYSISSFINFIRGRSYELKREEQERILELAERVDSFAKGLLTNINSLFFFENKEKVMRLVLKYEEFLLQFVEQIGRRISEFDLSKLVTSLNGKVAFELGRVLCRNYASLPKENRKIVLSLLDKNKELKEGFIEC